jgi:AraC-like DNA-binding protein
MVKTYVEAHLDEKVSAKYLAEKSSLSESYFCHAFKATFGISLTRYVRACRMERACQLMTETAMPLTAIAYECGLTDQSHLSRCFRQRYGLPPGRWRRQATQGNVDASAL